MDELPDEWTVIQGSAVDDQLSGTVLESSDRVYANDSDDVRVYVLSDRADTGGAIVVDTPGNRWLRWVGDTPDEANHRVRDLIACYDDHVSSGGADRSARQVNTAAFIGLERASTGTPPSPADISPTSFFQGQIPGAVVTGSYALSCPSWAEEFGLGGPDTHYELSSGLEETTFHVGWDDSWGLTISWYCPECDPVSLQEVNRVHIPYSEEWWNEVDRLQNHTGERPPMTYFALLWTYRRDDPSGDSMVVPDADREEEEVRYIQSTGDSEESSGLDSETRIEDRYQVTEQTSWDVDHDVIREHLSSPDRWYPYINGVAEDVLLECALTEVDIVTTNGNEATELVIQDPTIRDRDPRDYPWSEE